MPNERGAFEVGEFWSPYLLRLLCFWSLNIVLVSGTWYVFSSFCTVHANVDLFQDEFDCSALVLFL